jgi:[acyl-carrier-protein] S-malonyltransferase
MGIHGGLPSADGPFLSWYYSAHESRRYRDLLFSGQGVQRVGMANPWLEAFPKTAQPFLDEMDSILNYPLSRTIADGPNSKLNATENSQPAIMAVSILILRILEKEFGFQTEKRVDVTLGHSLGEFAALVVGGYLEYDLALKLARRRGEIMAQCSRDACEESGDTYGMVALVCEPDRLDSLISTIHEFLGHGSSGSKDDSSFEVPPIQQVLIANINSKNQIVLSGSLERIKALLVQLRQFGGHDPRAVILKSDSPFHSPIMAPAAEYMKRTLEKSDIRYPGIMPCISNVSALPFKSADDVRDLLSRQAVETVRWWDSIKYLHQEKRVKRWIGIGPGKVGRNIVGKEVGRVFTKGGGVWGLSDPREVEEILQALEETESAEDGD